MLSPEYLLFSQTNGYPGWTLSQIILLQGMVLLIIGLYSTFFGNAKQVFIQYCNEGELDRLLLKPVNLLYYIFAEGFSISNIGSVIAGIIIVVISIIELNISITPLFMVYFILSLLGSFLFYLTFDILFFCTTVFFIDTSRIIWVFAALQKFSNYPLELFSKAGQIILITILPFSIIAYFPTQILLNHVELFLFIAIAASFLWFFFVLKLWSFTIKRYVSAGG